MSFGGGGLFMTVDDGAMIHIVYAPACLPRGLTSPLMAAHRLTRLSALSRRSYGSVSTLSTAVRAKAEKLSADWKGTSATGGNTRNYIGGEFVESTTSQWHNVLDPVCIPLPRYSVFTVCTVYPDIAHSGS